VVLIAQRRLLRKKKMNIRNLRSIFQEWQCSKERFQRIVQSINLWITFEDKVEKLSICKIKIDFTSISPFLRPLTPSFQA
jgi:hypothetical protein